MKKTLILLAFIAIIGVMFLLPQNKAMVNCKYCNDTICGVWCECDDDFNCQDTIQWCNTCDSLFQADKEYYEDILNAMNDKPI